MKNVLVLAQVKPRASFRELYAPAKPMSKSAVRSSTTHGTALNAATTTAKSTRRAGREERKEKIAPNMPVVLAAEIAHDLNNALGSLGLHLDLLELSADNGEKVRQRLREIRPVIQHASDLALELTVPRRTNAGATENQSARRISLNPVLQRMLPMLSGILPRGTVLYLRLARDLAPVVIDPVHLVRIISNLVLNSRDAVVRATSGIGIKAGEITIETANWRVAASSRKSIRTAANKNRNWILLRVCDTGIGIEDAARARIFEPFFTTKSSGKSAGLGLSSVLRMVQGAGGTIQVESTPQKGTEITILLPSADTPKEKQLSHTERNTSARVAAIYPEVLLKKSACQHPQR